MVTGTEIMGAYQGLKATLDIVKGLNAAATNATVNEVKVALTQHILDAQVTLLSANEAQATAVHRITDLEQEIARLKDWSTGKERYELKGYYPGTFAYALKPSVAGSEPSHMLCAHCFQNGQKSILQATGHFERGNPMHICPSCRTGIPISGEMVGTAPANKSSDVSPVQFDTRYDVFHDQDP
jgi:hypothetical protein